MFWALVSHMQVLKLWAPDVGFKYFTQGEALGFEIPPDGGSLRQRLGLWRDRPSLSYSLDVFFCLFSTLLDL